MVSTMSSGTLVNIELGLLLCFNSYFFFLVKWNVDDKQLLRRKRYKRLATLCSDMDKIPSHYGFSLIVKQRIIISVPLA